MEDSVFRQSFGCSGKIHLREKGVFCKAELSFILSFQSVGASFSPQGAKQKYSIFIVQNMDQEFF